jgi:hypothetical protein
MILNVLALLVFFFGEKALDEAIAFVSNMPMPPPRSSPWFSWPTVKPIIALAYAIEILAIGWNEYDLAKWRGERNRALKVVFDEQNADRVRRAGGGAAAVSAKGKGRKRKRTP